MQGEPRPSYARRVVLAVIAVCLALIAFSALLPNPQQRGVAAMRRKLAGLTRVGIPATPPSPAFVIPWSVSPGPTPGRPVTIHVYLRVGIHTSRADLLTPRYAAGAGAKSRTVLHIAFDPSHPDEVRLLAAIAADPAKPNYQLLRDEFLTGRRTAGTHTFLRGAEVQAGPERLALARQKVLSELKDGTATACSPGTVLYEAGGRTYREPKTIGSGIGVPYTGTVTNAYEALEAMGDARVNLP